jgi:ABC-type transport system involved in multi-copper enzyme maturation permease subunit
MLQFRKIAGNAFTELARQPIFLLLMVSSALFEIFLSAAPYFGFGEDPKLVKDSVLAVMLLVGLFCAALSASSSLDKEIRSGTALAVLSKPIGKAKFLIAKFTGVAMALTLLAYSNLLASLMASRMAYDAYGDTDIFSVKIIFGLVVLAFFLGGVSNYFLNRSFVFDTSVLFQVALTISLVIIGFLKYDDLNHRVDIVPFGDGMDWRMVPACVLILFALWLLAGIATICSSRFETIPTLAICSGIFMLGLMSDYLFGTMAESGNWIGSFLYGVFPNWQLFWMADAMEGEKTIPWKYVGTTLGYVFGYLGASLSLALIVFENRELN